jgi:hypothetical protein
MQKTKSGQKILCTADFIAKHCTERAHEPKESTFAETSEMEMVATSLELTWWHGIPWPFTNWSRIAHSTIIILVFIICDDRIKNITSRTLTMPLPFFVAMLFSRVHPAIRQRRETIIIYCYEIRRSRKLLTLFRSHVFLIGNVWYTSANEN